MSPAIGSNIVVTQTNKRGHRYYALASAAALMRFVQHEEATHLASKSLKITFATADGAVWIGMRVSTKHMWPKVSLSFPLHASRFQQRQATRAATERARSHRHQQQPLWHFEQH